MPIATPPKFWRRCWATIPAAGCIGSWSIPGWPSIAACTITNILDAGMFLTYMSCDPEYAAENLQRIRERLRPGGRAKELPRRNSIRRKAKSIPEWCCPASVRAAGCSRVGVNWVQRREYRSVRQVLDSYDAVTLADLAAVQKTYPLSRSTTYVVGPLAEMAAPASDSTISIDFHRTIAPSPPYLPSIRPQIWHRNESRRSRFRPLEADTIFSLYWA